MYITWIICNHTPNISISVKNITTVCFRLSHSIECKIDVNDYVFLSMVQLDIQYTFNKI